MADHVIIKLVRDAQTAEGLMLLDWVDRSRVLIEAAICPICDGSGYQPDPNDAEETIRCPWHEEQEELYPL